MPEAKSTPSPNSFTLPSAESLFDHLADAAYLIEPMRGRRLPGVLWNGEAMLDSWDRIEAIERATGARLIATHALDFETAVPKPPDVWA